MLVGRQMVFAAHCPGLLRGSDTCACLASIEAAFARLTAVAALLDLTTVGALDKLQMRNSHGSRAKICHLPPRGHHGCRVVVLKRVAGQYIALWHFY